MSNDYGRGNGATYWHEVASFMGGSDLTPKAMSEIIAVQVCEAKSIGLDNVEIPVDFAWKIAGLLRDAKNKKGRRRHSFFERRFFEYFIRCARDHKRDLIAAGINPGEAHAAAIEWARHADRLTNMMAKETVSRAIYRSGASRQHREPMGKFSVAPSAGGPDVSRHPQSPEISKCGKSDG